MLPEIPANKIILNSSTGLVSEYKKYLLWSDMPWVSIHIKRLENGSYSFLHRSPEYGGGVGINCDLEHLLIGLEKSPKKKFLDLFNNTWSLEDLEKEYPNFNIETTE